MAISRSSFHCVFLCLSAFCAFYCYDGLFRERPFEILAYMAAVVVIIIYSIGNFGYQANRLQSDHQEISGDFILRIVSHSSFLSIS